MPDATPPTTSLFRRVLAVGVGLFATWQLFYLPAANLIDLIPRRPSGPPLEPIKDKYQTAGNFTSFEPLQRGAEYAGDVLDFWTEVSGQEQGWSLFAPGPPHYSLFAAVEFHFADGTSDTVLSQFEPMDKKNPPFRMPVVTDRLFNNEALLVYPAWFALPEMVEKNPDAYRDLHEVVGKWRGPYRAWLAWRMKRYLAAHPERGTPTVVILKHRFILTPHPHQAKEWTQPPQERPYVRWRPADDYFEVYDVVNHCFVPAEAKP